MCQAVGQVLGRVWGMRLTKILDLREINGGDPEQGRELWDELCVFTAPRTGTK